MTSLCSEIYEEDGCFQVSLHKYWDGVVDKDMGHAWVKNLMDMERLKGLKSQTAMVSEDAVDPKVRIHTFAEDARDLNFMVTYVCIKRVGVS